MKHLVKEIELDLGMEPEEGKHTKLIVDIEYTPGDEEADYFTVFLPCRHDPNCQEHRVIMNDLLGGGDIDDVYRFASAALCKLKEADA